MVVRKKARFVDSEMTRVGETYMAASPWDADGGLMRGRNQQTAAQASLLLQSVYCASVPPLSRQGQPAHLQSQADPQGSQRLARQSQILQPHRHHQQVWVLLLGPLLVLLVVVVVVCVCAVLEWVARAGHCSLPHLLASNLHQP